jgi:hypothetical protein
MSFHVGTIKGIVKLDFLQKTPLASTETQVEVAYLKYYIVL